MPKEELKWQNIEADDLPAAVKKSFDAMVEAEATFKADLEKLLIGAFNEPPHLIPRQDASGRSGVVTTQPPHSHPIPTRR